jgi:hypothetical protein
MRTLVKLSGILAVAICAAVQAHAQTISLVTDTFTYPDGAIPAPWTLFSGTTPINILSGQATITGANSGDYGLSIPGTHSSDKIFAAFDAYPVSWSQTLDTGYFALFKDASTFNFFARTYITNVVGGVQFGVSTGSAQPPVWDPTVVALNSSNRVTITLDQTGSPLGVNLVATISVNGDAGSSSYSMINSNYAISQFALRQSNATTMGNVLVDNLDVYVIPEPSTIFLAGLGLVGLLALRRRHS